MIEKLPYLLIQEKIFFKRVFLILTVLILKNSFILAQAPVNDDCSGAIALTVGTGSICIPITGDVTNATTSMSGCTGTSDDDIWYSFVASSSNQIIKVTPSASFDPVIQLFSGICGSLTSIKCSNEYSAGQIDKLARNDLSIGTTYYVRVYHFGAAKSATTTFDICVYQPTPPANDDCANAVLVNVGSTCVNTTNTTEGATDSGISESCLGTVYPSDDVWFKFTAPASGKSIIRVDASKDFRPVIEVFDACGGSSIACLSGTNHNVIIKLELSSLTPGNTYYFRVFDYFPNLPKTLTFELCVLDPPPPSNDECANAINVSSMNAHDYLSQTLNGATASITHPAVCAGNPDDDIWYKFMASSTRHMAKVYPSSGFDVVVQILDGCGAAANIISCANDSTMGDEELVKATGLTPGNTYYVRVFSLATGVTPTTSFDIAAFSLSNNDECVEAMTIIVGLAGNIITDSTARATQSAPPANCAPLSSSEDDLWYKFQASASDNTVTVDPSSGFDPVIELYDGCGGTLMMCKNDSTSGQNEKLTPVNLTAGQYYFVRIYEYGSSQPATQNFNIYSRGVQIQNIREEIINSLNIYPVPASSFVNVAFTMSGQGEILINVLSSNGKTVCSSAIGKQSGDINQRLDTSGLIKGIYLVQIIIDGNVFTKKIMLN